MLTPLAANPRQLREFFTEAGFTHEQFKQNPALRDLPSRRLGNLPDLAGAHRRTHRAARSVALVLPGRAAGERVLRGVWSRRRWWPTAGNGNAGSRGQPVHSHGHADACEGFLFAADPARTLESPESSGHGSVAQSLNAPAADVHHPAAFGGDSGSWRRLRDPGRPGRGSQPPGGGDGPEPARHRVCPLQRLAQRRNERRLPDRRYLRTGPGPHVRPDRQQPAVFRNAFRGSDLLRKQHGTGRLLPGTGPRGAGAT